MGKYKQIDLIELANFMAAAHYGVTLEQIMEEFDVSRRTAERRKDEVLAFVVDYEVRKDPTTGQKRWKIDMKSKVLQQLQSFNIDDIATLNILKKELETTNKTQFVRFINSLIEKVKVAQQKDSLDIDVETLMETEGFAVRQYPHFNIDKDLLSIIREAILSMKKVKIIYDKKGEESERIVYPFGILHGHKSYLIAYNETDKDEPPTIDGIRTFLLSRIKHIEILKDFIEEVDDFNFQEYVNQSFGIYQDDVMDVKLRISGGAIEDARSYNFHPSQKITDDGDNVIVEFRASGKLEICWELFKWGEYVEILEPAELKEYYKDQLKNILDKVGK